MIEYAMAPRIKYAMVQQNGIEVAGGRTQFCPDSLQCGHEDCSDRGNCKIFTDVSLPKRGKEYQHRDEGEGVILVSRSRSRWNHLPLSGSQSSHNIQCCEI